MDGGEVHSPIHEPNRRSTLATQYLHVLYNVQALRDSLIMKDPAEE